MPSPEPTKTPAETPQTSPSSDLENYLKTTQASIAAPSGQAPSIASVTDAPTPAPMSQMANAPQQKSPLWKQWQTWVVALILLLALAFVGFLTWRMIQNNKQQAKFSQRGAGNYDVISQPLAEIAEQGQASVIQVTDAGSQFTVNGQFNLNGRAVIASTTRPTNPNAGELWYQTNDNKLYFYNGSQYIDLTYANSVNAAIQQAVQSVQGQTGQVTLSAGPGIGVAGTTISNTGVISLESGSSLITVTDAGNGKYIIGDASGGGGGINLQLTTPGVAQSGNANITGTFISGQFQGGGSGLTNLNASNIASGTLADARLSTNVTLQGNTFNGANQLVQLNGASELPAVNGVNLTNLNASNIATGTLADARLSGNVTLQGNTFNGANQLVQLTGVGNLPALNGSALTNLNASNIASGTLADARLSANVALLNANQVFSGNNTFSGTLTAGTITSTGSLTVGNTGQALLLQGSSSSSFVAHSGANTTTVGFTGSPVGNLTYNFDMATTPGSYTICTTVGNCATSGGGVITPGGTTNKLAKFTGSQSIGDSSITDTGTAVTITPTSNSTATFKVQNVSNTSVLLVDTTNGRVAVGQASASYPLDVAGDINSSTGLRVAGNLVCDANGCNASGGSGFYIQNGITTQTSANFNIQSNSASNVVGIVKGAVGQSADLFQAQNSGGTPVAKITAAGNVDIVGNYYINGSQIASTNLSDSANLARLNASQTFTGNNTLTGTVLLQNASNSTTAFQIQNQAGTSNLFIADTQNTRVGIGKAPGYTLDVNGDVNIAAGSLFRIGGTPICGQVTATCAPSSGSTFYVQNGTSIQSSANFAIQSGSSGSVVGVLRGAASQSANLFEVQTSAPSTVFAINNVGNVVLNALGTTNTSSYLCLNASSQISSCSGSSSGSAFVQGGNSFGSTAVLGTNDAFGLTLKTGAATTAGDITVQPGSSNAASGTGASLSLTGGSQTGTGGTGGAVNITGGAANGASGTRTGGAVVIDSGVGTTANGGISIGVSNASTVSIGNTSSALTLQGNGTSGAVSIQAAASGTISVGTANVAGTINIGKTNNGAGTTSVNIATSSGAAQTIAIGGLGTSASTSNSGTAVAIQAGATSLNLTSTGGAKIQNYNGSTTAFQVLQSGGTDLFTVDTTNNRTILRGANSNATVGSELLSGNCSGTNWSGTGNGPYTHTAGASNVLACTVSGGVTAGNIYQVTWTQAPSAATTIFSPTVGGSTVTGFLGSGSNTVLITAATTAGLSFSINNAADTGTISGISIKLVTNKANPLLVGIANTASVELRVNDLFLDSMFFGQNSGQNNISGLANTGFGILTLANNTTGLGNAAFGYAPLQNNTTGGSNTAVGFLALNANTVASNNTAIGSSALANNTVGQNNTAVGYNASYQDAAAGSFVTPANVNNTTTLGYGAQVQQSNSLILGGIGTTSNNLTPNVGIGTTMPTNLLSVSPNIYDTGTAGTGGVSSAIVTGSGTSWTSAMVGNEIVFATGVKATITAVSSATSMVVSPAVTVNSSTAYRIHQPALQVTSTGKIGIGTATPTANLQVTTQTNTTTALVVQQANGSASLTVDTSGNAVNIGTGSVQAGITSWTAASQASPSGTGGQSMATATLSGAKYVYILPGGSNTVYYAIQQADGSLGTWTAGPTLPASRYGAMLAVDPVNNYIYVVGGFASSVFGTAAQNTVYFSLLNTSTGAPGSWTASANNLSTAVGLGAAFVNNSKLYVLGGATQAGGYGCSFSICLLPRSGTEAATVQTSALTVGIPGVFGTTAALPQALANFGMATDGSSNVWVFGGFDSTNTAASVFYRGTIASGAISSWTTLSNGISNSGFGQTGAYANGNIYNIAYPTASVSNGSAWASMSTTSSNSSTVVAGNYMYTVLGNSSGIGNYNYALIPGSSTSLNVTGNQTNYGSITQKNTFDSTTAFQVQNASGVDVMTVDTTNSQLSVRGINSVATIGSELLSGNCSGTNWSGTGSGPYTHATGSSAALSCTVSGGVVAGATYQVSFTYNTSNSANYVYPTIGGASGQLASRGASGNALNIILTATSTAGLTFTISDSTDTGNITGISIMRVTSSNGVLQVKNSDATVGLEVRAGGTGLNNTFVGLNSGSSNTTGNNNTGFGNGALQYNTTGNWNSGFGYAALQSNVSGTRNTAVGYGSLQYNTSGVNNTALGFAALQQNTIGGSNVALGFQALTANTSGGSNVAIGSGALQTNATNSNNIAIGASALALSTSDSNVAIGGNSLGLLTTGANNTAIGYRSGQRDPAAGLTWVLPGTITNATMIGYGSLAQQSNSLILGGIGTTSNNLTPNVGIGTTMPTNLLSVSPNIYDTGTAGTGGVSSTTVTGSGTSWTSAYKGSEIIFADGVKATITAVASSTSMTVTPAVTEAAGTRYRIHQPLLQVSTSNNGRVGIGTASPSAALEVALSGAASSSAAYLSGSWFTGGTSTTTKPQLLIQPSTATSNNWSTAGTGIGVNAANGFSGNLLDLQVNGARQMRIADNGTIYWGSAADCNGGCISSNFYGAFGDLGIQAASGQINLISTQVNSIAPIRVGDTANASWVTFRANSTDKWSVGADNNSPAGADAFAVYSYANARYHFSIAANGASYFSADTTNNVAQFLGTGANQCTVVAGTGWSCSSDERLKTNIAAIDTSDALSKLMRLQGVNFNWNSDPNGTMQDGFIAQAVQQIFPELVTNDSNGYLSLNKDGILPFTVAAIQEQQKQINALQQQGSAQGFVLPSDATFANLNVSGNASFANLTVVGSASIGANLTVGGNLTVVGTITTQTLKVNGKIIGNPDTRGKLTIPAGGTYAEYTFTVPYDEIPNIVATPTGNPGSQYWVSDITKTGFKVNLATAPVSNIDFNFQAQQ